MTANQDSQSITLTKDEKYNWQNLDCIGWTAGDGSGDEGYCVGDYFDADGYYLGADYCGIEPLFGTTTHLHYTYVGDYGMMGEAKLIETATGWIWVADKFCGLDSLEGGALRPFATRVSPETARRILAAWDPDAEDWRVDMSDYYGGLDGFLAKVGVNFGSSRRV